MIPKRLWYAIAKGSRVQALRFDHIVDNRNFLLRVRPWVALVRSFNNQPIGFSKVVSSLALLAEDFQGEFCDCSAGSEGVGRVLPRRAWIHHSRDP